MCLNLHGPVTIVVSLLGVMLAAIHFYDDTLLYAGEVHDEARDGMLSTELMTIHLAKPKMPPKRAFRSGRTTSELACLLDMATMGYGGIPHPNLPPQGEGIVCPRLLSPAA